MTLREFSKKQAISLINKIEYDEAIKTQFVKALDEYLYKNHKSFASNPLLLNIMLLTYDNYAEIPEKLHLFYSNAFDTLYSKHDATKGGYKRELKSKLSFDSFKKIFSYFCFISYYQGKIEFSYDDLCLTMKKVNIKNISFDTESVIDDLINSICVIYRDGINYRFAHRSFQEYFSAIFLKELPDSNMTKMSIELIKKDPYRASHDSVFVMLYDMNEERVEQNIFLPILQEIEQECTIDKYDFYFNKCNPIFSFDFFENDGMGLALYTRTEYDLIGFVREILRRRRYDFGWDDECKLSQEKLFEYFTCNHNYELGAKICGHDYIEDETVFQLIKRLG